MPRVALSYRVGQDQPETALLANQLEGAAEEMGD
jgi:hypothetical protein